MTPQTQLADEDVAVAEAEMIRQEQRLEAEIARLKGLRQEAERAASGANVEVKVPSVSVRKQVDEARLARLKALGVRKAAFDSALKALRVHEVELDRVFDRVKKAKEQAELAERQAAEESLAATMIRAIETEALKPAPAPQPKPQVRPEQRRATQRVSLCAEISLGSDSNFFTGFTNDVSEGGVFVATVNVMPIGTQVDLSFSLPGGPTIAGKGEVRWVREFDHKNPEVFPGMGIRFTDIPLPSVQAIHGFTQQREPMFFPEH